MAPAHRASAAAGTLLLFLIRCVGGDLAGGFGSSDAAFFDDLDRSAADIDRMSGGGPATQGVAFVALRTSGGPVVAFGFSPP